MSMLFLCGNCSVRRTPAIAACIRNPAWSAYLLIQVGLSNVHVFAYASMAHTWPLDRTFTGNGHACLRRHHQA